MTSHWITECPHCGTSFRVTEQHLRAAKGSVRCGSCLQVFNAINTLFPDDTSSTGDHLGSTTPSASAAQPAYKSTVEPTAENISAHAHVDTPHPEIPQSPLTKTASSISVVEAFVSGEVAYEHPNPRQAWEDAQAQYDHQDNDVYTDEPNHEVVHDDQQALKSSLGSPSRPSVVDDEFGRDDQHQYNKPPYSETVPTSPWHQEDDFTTDTQDQDQQEEALFVESFESDATLEKNTTSSAEPSSIDPYHELASRLALNTPTSTQAAPAATQPPTQPAHNPRLAEDILLSHESHIANHDELESESVDLVDNDDWPVHEDEQEPHIGPYREPFRDALLSELEAEPPRGFDWEDDHHKPARWVWVLAGVVLVLALGVQYILFHYNDFANTLQKPPFDSLMRGLCENINCDFIKTDLSLVANENLLIRAHPTENGYLVLDTILENHAPFEQPFPLLDLSFSNMANKPIARRVFKPEEYLTGDLAGMMLMPMNTPLHISFAIKNPSELATNYELKLIANSR